MILIPLKQEEKSPFKGVIERIKKKVILSWVVGWLQPELTDFTHSVQNDQNWLEFGPESEGGFRFAPTKFQSIPAKIGQIGMELKTIISAKCLKE